MVFKKLAIAQQIIAVGINRIGREIAFDTELIDKILDDMLHSQMIMALTIN
jgi:hypothetical protein